MFELVLKEVQLGDSALSLGSGKLILIIHPCEMLDLKVLPKDVVSVNQQLVEQKLDLSASDDQLRAATLVLTRRGMTVISWATKITATCAVISSRKDLTARFRLTAGKKSKLQDVVAAKNDLIKWTSDHSTPTFATLLEAVSFCQKRPAIEYDPTGLTQQLPVNEVSMTLLSGSTSAAINGVIVTSGKDKVVKYLSYDAGLIDYWEKSGPSNFQMLMLVDRPVPDMYKSFFLHRNITFYPLFMQTNLAQRTMKLVKEEHSWDKVVIMSVEGNEARVSNLLLQLKRQSIADVIVINGKAGLQYLPFASEIKEAKSEDERWVAISKMNDALKQEGKLDKNVTDIWKTSVTGKYSLIPPSYIAHYSEFSELLVQRSARPGVTVYLEDDSHICDGFEAKVSALLASAPPDWDVIVLGYDSYLYSKYDGAVSKVNDTFVTFTGTKSLKAEGLNAVFPVGSLIGIFGLIINNDMMKKIYVEMWPMKYAVDVLLGQLNHVGKIRMYGLSANLVLEDKQFSESNFGVPLDYVTDDSWNNVNLYKTSKFKGVVCLVGSYNPATISVLSDRVACFNTYVSAMLWRIAAEHVTSSSLRDSIYKSD